MNEEIPVYIVMVDYESGIGELEKIEFLDNALKVSDYLAEIKERHAVTKIRVYRSFLVQEETGFPIQ